LASYVQVDGGLYTNSNYSTQGSFFREMIRECSRRFDVVAAPTGGGLKGDRAFLTDAAYVTAGDGSPREWVCVVSHATAATWEPIENPLTFEQTVDLTNLAAGATRTETAFTATGVKVDDRVQVFANKDVLGLVLSAFAPADNQLQMRSTNPTAAAVDLPNMTYRYRVTR
jgi:hypothetical protein